MSSKDKKHNLHYKYITVYLMKAKVEGGELTTDKQIGLVDWTSGVVCILLKHPQKLNYMYII